MRDRKPEVPRRMCDWCHESFIGLGHQFHWTTKQSWGGKLKDVLIKRLMCDNCWLRMRRYFEGLEKPQEAAHPQEHIGAGKEERTTTGS